MKFYFVIAILFVFAIFPSRVLAQVDEREPGLYAIVREVPIHLTYTNGITEIMSRGVFENELRYESYRYKGETSGTNAGDTFLLVIDTSKKLANKSLKKDDIFLKGMNPRHLRIIPLLVNSSNHCREYDGGQVLNGIKLESGERTDFEWERINDNSFIIKVIDASPGEYGFIYRTSLFVPFDYTGIFGFTIPATVFVKEDLE